MSIESIRALSQKQLRLMSDAQYQAILLVWNAAVMANRQR